MKLSGLVLPALLVAACTVGEVDDDEPTEALEYLDEAVDESASAALGENCNPPAFATGTGTRVTLGGHAAWTHFTSNNGTADSTILDETERLIWQTPNTGTIRGTIHNLGKRSIARALLCKAKAGVQVKLVFNGNNKGGLAEQLVHANIETKFCDYGEKFKSCFTRDKPSIMHTKLFLFSATQDPTGALRQNVVWFGSANLTDGTGSESFNNSVTVYGDAGLFDGALQYFRDLRSNANQGQNYYTGSRGFVRAPAGKLYFSPSPSTDLIERQLDVVKGGTDCTIRVAQAYLEKERLALAKRIATLADQGCNVRVVGNSNHVDAEMKQALRGIPFKTGRVHDKYIAIHARFGTEPGVRKLVFTGSHNFTAAANAKNDELFAKLEGDVYDAYLDHFQTTWSKL
jgi:phosphatidylserine/phosphatidylglycerophosphate/cardiolipin synthase-like enzyme